MNEKLLQFIWQHQYFNTRELTLDTGESVDVLSPGELNAHQGPDFLNAGIRIGNTAWAGSIELHLLASGWNKHRHEADGHYNNVILHVVWENDLAHAITARKIPLLVLRDRVPKLLLHKYEDWMKSRDFVPCQGQLGQVNDRVWSFWKDQLVMERLARKTHFIEGCLRDNRQHWEETAWWLMVRNFGFPVNTGAFESIARSLPYTVISRHRDRPEELKALLLGQSGLLEGAGTEDYPASLTTRFCHLRGKYRLRPIHEPLLRLRMRPGNFPAVRLEQLAGLVHHSFPWFNKIREAGSMKELKELLNSGAGIGPTMKDNILINTFLPLLFAYGTLRGTDAYRKKALEWLHEIRAEKNALTGGWLECGVANRHAADSQALIELKTCYCNPRKCLECGIGKALLEGAVSPVKPANPPSS